MSDRIGLIVRIEILAYLNIADSRDGNNEACIALAIKYRYRRLNMKRTPEIKHIRSSSERCDKVQSA